MPNKQERKPIELRRLKHWAAELDVSVDTLYEAIDEGLLEAVQTGRGNTSPFRCTREQIEAWLESRKVVGRKSW